MAIAVREFIDNLEDSRIISPEQIREVRASTESDGETDAIQLSNQLVDRQVLTAYQAAAIAAGEYQNLTFGEYVILDEIGRGGMGRVLRARHRRMDRDVAIKVMSDSALTNDDLVARFHKEVRAAAKLEHPNIVRAYDAGEHQGMHFLAMEFIDGSDIANLINNDGPLPVKRAIDYIIQAAIGLGYAHKQGLIHRDVKPQNLLVDQEGVVRVLDLGLARFEQHAAGDEELTKSDQIMGTVAYMSPEQAADTRQADERSDVYSLGCTLFCMLTGSTPYGGVPLVEHVLAHREAPIPSVQERQPQVSAEIDAVVRRMMAKEPDDRFQSMDEVIAALQSPHALSSAPTKPAGDAPTEDFKAPRPKASSAKNDHAGPPKRNHLPRMIVGLIIALAGAYIIWQSRPPEGKPRGELIWKDGRADVLQAIDPVRDNWAQSKKGRADFRGDTLVLPSNTRVLVRHAFPAEYELKMRIRQTGSVDEPILLIVSRLGTSLFGLVIGGQDENGRYVSGLQVFEQNGLHEPTVQFSDRPIIVHGQTHKIRLRVHEKGVLAAVDDQVVLDWTGGFDDFPIKPTTIRSLAFTTNLTEIEIESAEITDLSANAETSDD